MTSAPKGLKKLGRVLGLCYAQTKYNRFTAYFAGKRLWKEELNH